MSLDGARSCRALGSAVLFASSLAFVLAAPRAARADSEKTFPDGVDIASITDFGALAFRRTDEGVIAKSCVAPKGAKGPLASCKTDDGTTYRFPAAARARLKDATLRPVRTSKGREAIMVDVPIEDDRFFRIVLAPGPDETPRVVWSGFTGTTSGNELTIEKDGKGEKIHVKSSFSLCGRSIAGADRLLDPTSLDLVSKDMPDPVAAERKQDVRKGVAGVSSNSIFPLLRARAATSGTASLTTDGDDNTAWEPESRGFEAISFDGSPGVGARGLDIAFASTLADAPRSIVVVTDDKAFAVDVPADPSATHLDVPFETPLHAKCLAIVVGPFAKGARAGLTKVALTTAVDGKDLATLAATLDTPDAHEAFDILMASGENGASAAVVSYDSLGVSGQELARRVIDSSSCHEKLGFYVPRLAAKDHEEADRAHEEVAGCGKEAIAPLVAAIDQGAGKGRVVFAEELGLLSPNFAIPALLRGLGKSDAEDDRVVFRRGLLKASKRERSAAVFDTELASDTYASLSPVARIDVLRGMGERIGDVQRSADVFTELWKASATEFRGRYLLLGPAGELAKKGFGFAENVLTTTMTSDTDPHLRARAATVAAGNPKLEDALRAAAHDPDPRVREAAGQSLAAVGAGLDTQRLLAGALATEAWTFVKRASIAAIASGADAADVDATLAKTIDAEEQPIVRSDIVTALGTRGARTTRSDILARVNDEGEAIFVRVAAVEALGGLCDASTLGDLTNLAQRGKAPGSESEAKLAMGAIKALGKLHPSDLKDRLAPVLATNVIVDVRASARAALEEEHTCPVR